MNDFKKTANKIRRLLIESLEPNGSHHIGCSLSIVDIMTYFYFDVMRIFPTEPKNLNRDIFILSKGHGALGLYATLCQRGFFNKKVLSTYDKNGGQMPEHASSQIPGVEVSTGSLGHGLPIANGFATSFKNDGKKNKIYVLMSDGEFDEGSNWEAIMYAGHHKLNNLIVVVDVNGYQGYASTANVIDLSPLEQKIADFNWETYQTDGHNFQEMEKTFSQIKVSSVNKPKMIFAKTIKGKDVPYFEGKFESHYQSLDQETKSKILAGMQGYK